MDDRNKKRLDAFFSKLEKAHRGLLMLDYDGTLAPFRVERDRATPYPGVRELLEKIRRTGKTRLVVISGRTIDDLKPLLGLNPPPEIWGSHGLEHLREDGRYERIPISKEQQIFLEKLAQWAEKSGWAPHFEPKPGGAAFHWRGLSEAKKERLEKEVLKNWKLVAESAGFLIYYFDGGLEFRVPGVTKGEVVTQLLGEVKWDTVSAYLGDDATDEDAFKTLGNRGLAVLVRKDPRPTAAAIRLIPPDELIEFLKMWLKASGGTE